MLRAISTKHFVGIVRAEPCKSKIVHAFDFDDTITVKPHGFDNTGLSSSDYFDAARHFTPDEAIVDLLRLQHRVGDRIAIATARPPERLIETYQWLIKYRIPFDVLMHSTGVITSGMAKQHMLKYLRKSYRMVGTLVDDSPWNIEGARLQRIKRIHVRKNCAYWASNPEIVVKV